MWWGDEPSDAEVWLEVEAGMLGEVNLDLLCVGCDNSIIFSIWENLCSALRDLCSLMKELSEVGEMDPVLKKIIHSL